MDDETRIAYLMLDSLITAGEAEGANPDDSVLLTCDQEIAHELGETYRGYRVWLASSGMPLHAICLAKRFAHQDDGDAHGYHRRRAA